MAIDITARANIVMAGLQQLISRAGTLDESAIKNVALRQTGLLGIRTPFDLQEVKTLSGDTQQKVVIAKWLLRDSEVFIFGEPKRGIGAGAKSKIQALLEQLAAQGRASIVIFSERPEVLRLPHRIAVMCEVRRTGVRNAMGRRGKLI